MHVGKMREEEEFASVRTCSVGNGRLTLESSPSAEGVGKPSIVAKLVRVRDGRWVIDSGAALGKTKEEKRKGRRKNLVLRTEEKMGMKELQEVKKEIKNSNVNLSLLLSTIQLMRMRIHLLEEVTFPQAPLMVITITIIVAAATLVEVVRFPSRILLVEIVVKKEVLLMLDPLVVEPLDFSTTPMPTALSQQLLLPPRM